MTKTGPIDVSSVQTRTLLRPVEREQHSHQVCLIPMCPNPWVRSTPNIRLYLGKGKKEYFLKGTTNSILSSIAISMISISQDQDRNHGVPFNKIKLQQRLRNQKINNCSPPTEKSIFKKPLGALRTPVLTSHALVLTNVSMHLVMFPGAQFAARP